MNNKDILVSNQYGEIKITDRKKANLTGIKKLVSFNPTEFVIDSLLGGIILKGDSLEIVKLDTNEGVLSLKGHVDSIVYTNNSQIKESILSRLFK